MNSLFQKAVNLGAKPLGCEPNYNGFVVIGAGLPRTGTLSLKKALEILLDGPCYHMMCVAQGGDEEVQFWNTALQRPAKESDWIQFLGGRGYRAGVDYPISFFYRDLIAAYPNAKVILSTRNPETWYLSVKDTIYRAQTIMNQFATQTFLRLAGKIDLVIMMNTLMNSSSEGMDPAIFEAIENGPEPSAQFFNDWAQSVKDYVPPERLLVFEAKQGWEPLCQFLDQPIPDVPYPRLNDTAEMQRRHALIQIMSHGIVFGVPLVVALGMSYFFIA